MAYLPDFLGLLGSLLLVWPAWSASRLMRDIADVAESARADVNSGNHGAVGARLVPVMTRHLSRWHARDHWLLFGGMVLLVLSFAARLLLDWTASAPTAP